MEERKEFGNFVKIVNGKKEVPGLKSASPCSNYRHYKGRVLNSAGPRIQQLQPLQGPQRDMHQRRDNVSDVVRPRRGRSLAIAEPGEGHLIPIIAAIISFTYNIVALFPSAVTYP